MADLSGLAFALLSEHYERTGHRANIMPFKPEQVRCNVCMHLRPIFMEMEAEATGQTLQEIEPTAEPQNNWHRQEIQSDEH